MVDKRTPVSPEHHIDHKDVESSATDESPMRPYQHSTMIMLSPSVPSKSVPRRETRIFYPATVHQRIYDTIKTIDDTVVIIISEKTGIAHSKDMSSGAAYEHMFLDIRTCAVTKCVYLTFKL